MNSMRDSCILKCISLSEDQAGQLFSEIYSFNFLHL